MLELFSPMWDGHVGRITIAKHRIEMNTRDIRPINSAPYRVGPAARAFEKEEQAKMTKMRVIEPAQREWAAPTVLAHKKDGPLRFCVD